MTHPATEWMRGEPVPTTDEALAWAKRAFEPATLTLAKHYRSCSVERDAAIADYARMKRIAANLTNKRQVTVERLEDEVREALTRETRLRRELAEADAALAEVKRLRHANALLSDSLGHATPAIDRLERQRALLRTALKRRREEVARHEATIEHLTGLVAAWRRLYQKRCRRGK